MPFIKLLLFFLTNLFFFTKPILIFNDTQFPLNYTLSSNRKIMTRGVILSESFNVIDLKAGNYQFTFSTSRHEIMEVAKQEENFAFEKKGSNYEEVAAYGIAYNANYSLLDYKNEKLSVHLSIETEKLNALALAIFPNSKITEFKKLVVKAVRQ